MRFDPDEAAALAAALTPPRRAGSPAADAAATRLEGLLREAGYRVERSRTSSRAELPQPPLGFALAAAAAGFVLEALHRLGRPSGPRELAIACGSLVLVGLLERRAQLGSWAGPGPALPTLAATDPRSERATARLVLATPLETPPPPSARWLGRVVLVLQAAWLALLWLPCLRGDAHAWLSLAGPGLLGTLGLIALLPSLDPWTRQPSPYPGDNRSGPALAVALARAWPDGLAARVALDLRIEPDEPGRPPGAGAATVVWLASPGVGGRIGISGDRAGEALATAAARELWLPFAVPVERTAARRGPRGGTGVWIALTGRGPARPDGQPDPALLRATAQLIHELALRLGREATTAG
jgi:hypothetical protein